MPADAPNRSRVSTRQRRLPIILIAYIGCFGCGNKPMPTSRDQTPASKPITSRSLTAVDGSAPIESNPGRLTLPANFGKHTGDLDEMVKRRTIRALVIVNPIGFFYKAGRPAGIQYEALQEFQKFVNHKLKTGKLPITVDFLPVRPDQLEAALTEGMGDMIAHGIVITPEREKRVAFSVPIQTNVTQVVVTGRALAGASGFDGMSGKAIYVNPLTTYYENLHTINQSRQKAGKAPLDIRSADKNLSDDDLIEMVNAGLIPATVTTGERAKLWSQVLPNITPHPEMTVAAGTDLAWVMRKNNPQFKHLVDECVRENATGTSFGNTVLRRYLQNTKWIKNSTSPEEIRKFDAYVGYFKKYAAEYDFDYLMLAAQGYQESLLDQQKRSRVGAVGIMQVIPKFAAAKPIDVPNVDNGEDNIHAGAKMLRNIADTYFNDPGIDPLNKTLFSFASYNAGPNRIARLRTKARDDGLDPDKWFGNVELEVAKSVGQETVNYVGNIYKYYVAYKLTLEPQESQIAKAESAH